MNARTIVNLVLFITLLVLLVFFLYKKNQTIAVKRLTSLPLESINQIVIPRNNASDIVLRKQQANSSDSAWRMLEPYNISAHQFRIQTLLGLTQIPVNKTYDINTVNLVDFSLDKPRARIIFNSTEIAFGKSNPMNNKRYLMSEKRMALLDDQIYPLVSAQAATFIDLSLLAGLNNISAIQLPDITIQKNSQKHWHSTPANVLNADQVQILLEHWKSAQAFSVHAYLERKHLGFIKIQSDRQEIIFEITDDDPWLILARPDLNIEYHLDSALKARLLGSVDA